jgi:hypothetical protein
VTDDDELAEARATGRARGEAAPPLSPALADYVNTVLAEPMREVRRRHEGRSDAQVPRSSTDDRRSRRRA